MKKFILSVIVVMIFLIVGTMDYNDYLMIEKYKCEQRGGISLTDHDGIIKCVVRK